MAGFMLEEHFVMQSRIWNRIGRRSLKHGPLPKFDSFCDSIEMAPSVDVNPLEFANLEYSGKTQAVSLCNCTQRVLCEHDNKTADHLYAYTEVWVAEDGGFFAATEVL